MLNIIIIREVQIKITMRYHLTPLEWLLSKRKITFGEDMEKRELVHCCWECRLVQPLWKTV